MTRGRKPTPTILKMAAGNPGKRPLPKNEPQAEIAIPERPAELNDIAAAEWDRITPLLQQSGLITLLDRSTLAIYCQTYAIWVEAEERVKKKGRVCLTEKGYPMLNPWHTVATNAAKDLKAFATEFGLSASARTRIGANKSSDELSDPLSAFAKKRSKA